MHALTKDHGNLELLYMLDVWEAINNTIFLFKQSTNVIHSTTGRLLEEKQWLRHVNINITVFGGQLYFQRPNLFTQ